MSRIHWTAPLFMIGALIAGSCFAIAHHLFYQSLHGTPVPEHDVFGTGFSRQQMNLAIGTALSFLTKAALVYGVLMAYTQLFWKATARTETGIRLETLNSLHRGPTDFLVLGNLKLWFRFHLLLIVAVIAWVIPVSSIITPSTLSTQNVLMAPTPVEERFVPRLNFDSLSFLADPVFHMTFGDGGFAANGPVEYVYQGAGVALSTATNAFMSGGSIPFITPPAANSSWSMAFAGPAIDCPPASEAQYGLVQKNIADFVSESEPPDSPTHPVYLGWFGNGMPMVPASRSNSNETYTTFASGELDGTELDGTVQIWVASPSYLSRISSRKRSESNDTASTASRGTLLQCRLFNSSYNLEFFYEHGIQSIKIRSELIDRDAPMWIRDTLVGPGFDGNDHALPFKCSDSPLNTTVPCTAQPETLRPLSYQAVYDAFMGSVVGMTSFTEGHWAHAGVSSNALSRSRELQAIPGEQYTLLSVLGGDFPMLTGEKLHPDWSNSSLSLRDAMEGLFRNLTVSLMASPSLRLPYNATTAPLVNVTMPARQIVYLYSSAKLFIAYGVAVHISALATLVGIITIFLNKASYSSDFSTIFRAAKGATITSTIEDKDLTGCDPLPKNLKRAKVVFRKHALDTRRDSVMDLGNGKDWDGASDQVPLMPLSSASSRQQLSSRASLPSSMRTVSASRPDGFEPI